MIILRKSELTANAILYIQSAYANTIDTWDIDEDVSSVFKSLVLKNLTNLATLGVHIIGKWNYDTEQELFTNIELIRYIAEQKLLKYRPYLLVFNNEFVKVDEKENRDYTNSAHGTTRGAIEDSPITSAPITSAPDDSTEWNLTNPTMKNGSQFDNEYERNEQVLNPEWQLRLLKFNVGELNLSRIAEMFVKSLIEEYNTVY